MSEKQPDPAAQTTVEALDAADPNGRVSTVTVLTSDLTPISVRVIAPSDSALWQALSKHLAEKYPPVPGQEVLKGQIGVLDCGINIIDTGRRAQEVAEKGLVDIGVGQEQADPWPSWPDWPEDALIPHPVSGRMVHPDEVHPTPTQRQTLADWLIAFMKRRADAAGMSVEDWIKNEWQKDGPATDKP